MEEQLEAIPITQRYGIKAKKVIDPNAGSVLALPEPRVELKPAEETRIRTAFASRESCERRFGRPPRSCT